MTVTTFSAILDANNPVDISVEKLLHRFKTEDRNAISELKLLRDEEYGKRKATLPVVCFGGTFTKRAKDGLKKASGLMVLDFDKVETSYRDKLQADEYIYSCFASPSGRGFKALVKIPVVKSDADYKSYYLSFSKRYAELDESGKDISRACFFCFDPELYINEKAKTWNEKFTDKQKPFNRRNVEYTDYSVVNKCLNIIRRAVEGERHTKILSASRLMGGYVASGKIDYDEAVRLLEQEAYNIDPSDFSTNKKAIFDGLEHGAKDPIEVTEKLQKEENVKEKFGKIYFTAADLNEEIRELFIFGQQRGHDFGFECVKDLYTVKPGTTTYIYGPPYSGKSQIWFEGLVNLSSIYGLKHLIFSPETGTAPEIFAELMAMVAYQDFYDSFNAQMSEQDYADAKSFVDSHFIIVDPKDNVITIQDVFDYADIIERVYNVKLHTLTVDPWNELKHDYREFGGARDQYLEMVLGQVRQNARARERHNCVITHTQQQDVITDKDTKKRYYPPATFHEIANGQAWPRKGMAMISIWRPPGGVIDPETGVPYEENETQMIIQKAKPKGIGKNGIARLYFDAKMHRYFERVGPQFMYGRKVRDEVLEAKMKYSEVGDIPF